MPKRKLRVWHVRHGAERRSNRFERQLARLLLKRGVEPEPRYNTGKFWID